MKLGSTLDVGRLPGTKSILTVAADEEHIPGFVTCQFFYSFVWALIGMYLLHYVPEPWGPWATGFGFLACYLFSLLFIGHYREVCLAELGWPDQLKYSWRCSELSLGHSMTWWFLPYTGYCALRYYSELCRAWSSWFLYNRQGDVGIGLLRSPAGSQFVRVWLFRFTIMLLGAGLLQIPALGLAHDDLGHLAYLSAITPFAVIAVASLTAAPLLRTLRELRSDD